MREATASSVEAAMRAVVCTTEPYPITCFPCDRGMHHLR